jgi:long-chain acyl-CoA synthetase
VREAREENALRQEVLRAIAAANSTVSRSESIRVFRVLQEPFAPSNGLLTPSMKLRRDAIVRRYGPEIDAMYATAARADRGGFAGTTEDFMSWDEADDVFRRARP